MPTRAKTSGCIHHWEIELADGPVSNGTCKNCGEQKGFQNSIMTDSYNITLEKEKGYDPTEQKKGWNRWQGD